MTIEELTPEQLVQAKQCTSAEDALEFIDANNIELTDEELEKISGGSSFACFFGYHSSGTATGNTKQYATPGTLSTSILREYICSECGKTYWI